MKRATKSNLAASVSARLLNRGRETGDDYQTLLTSYCLERFLYRLSVSDRRDRFVLKGVILPRCVVKLLVEMLEPYRGRVYDPCKRRQYGAPPVGNDRFVRVPSS